MECVRTFLGYATASNHDSVQNDISKVDSPSVVWCRLVAKLQSLMSTVLDSFKTLRTNFIVMIYFMCIRPSL